MDQQEFKNQIRHIYRIVMVFFGLILLISVWLLFTMVNPSFFSFETKDEQYAVQDTIDENKIENGIHVATGFKEGEGLQTVITSCTPCHSAKLVTQNRASREGWVNIIRWMQDTQNLWDLGDNEDVIVNYLATHYAPEEKGRREPLTNIQWYDLED